MKKAILVLSIFGASTLSYAQLSLSSPNTPVTSNTNNVGIGTTNPNSPLTVIPGGVGQTPIATPFSSQLFYPGITVSTTSRRSGFVAWNNNGYLNGDDNNGHFVSLIPWSDNGNNNDLTWKAFRLKSGSPMVDQFWIDKKGNSYFAGKMGIGTTLPLSKLHVSDIDRTTLTIGGPSTSSQAVGDLTFKPSNTSPVGGAAFWTWSFRTDNFASNIGDFVLYSNNNLSYTTPIIAQADGDLILGTGNTGYRLGNVGIGTTAPAYKLDVVGESHFADAMSIGTTKATSGFLLSVGGSVRAEEIEVSLTTTWPDYVFSEDYELKPLSEVELYIKENSHLPNVPSDEEVSENGINLGEMDAILLQKIEELTLYVIELEKKIAKQ